MRLYDRAGGRLYLNLDERQRFEATAALQPPSVALFCAILLHSGCRLSEALSLTGSSFQRSERCLSVITLKKRRPGVVREIPVPDELFLRLPHKETDGEKLFPWHRSTAWRLLKCVFADAGISGPQAMPKGLRHGFGVHAIKSGVPLNLVSRWLGHASLTTTAIYTNASGPEEREIAERMW